MWLLMKTIPYSLLAALLLLFTSGCVTRPPSPPPLPKKPEQPSPKSYWKGAGVQGNPCIIVDLSEQRAYFFKADQLVGETRCSSGKKGFRTPPGEYKVTQKDKNHVSNLYGNFVDATGVVLQKDVDTSKMKTPEGASFAGAKMPFFLRFHAGYGLHSGRVPNYPASHGCVRLPYNMAEQFFHSSSLGTPVIVQE